MMSPDSRRRFLARMATLGAALGLAPADATASSAPSGALAADEPWMKKLTGKQRVVFHSHVPTDGQAIRWATTFLDTQKSAYSLTDADSTVVVGLNGRAIGWFFSNALWTKYPSIGDTMGTPGTQNPQAAAVQALVPRGAVLLVCNNSIRAAAPRFLTAAQQADPALRASFADEIKANLLPGVEVVPAMVVTLQQAQDRACRYVYAGG